MKKYSVIQGVTLKTLHFWDHVQNSPIGNFVQVTRFCYEVAGNHDGHLVRTEKNFFPAPEFRERNPDFWSKLTILQAKPLSLCSFTFVLCTYASSNRIRVCNVPGAAATASPPLFHTTAYTLPVLMAATVAPAPALNTTGREILRYPLRM